MNKENILGFDVCNTSIDNLINSIFTDFNSHITNFIVNINPEIIIKNYRNKKIVNYFNSQKYQIPDGVGVVLASKINHGNIKNRITGIDLMNFICRESVKYNAKIFFYGSKDGIAKKAKNELEILYPNINIVGTCNGYTDEKLVLEKINELNPDILFVGLGSPMQEQFIMENQPVLKNIKIFMPVGGSFDVISKTLKRAPSWIIKANLEWLYRLFQEPKRFFRQFNLIKFVFLIVFRRKSYGKN